MFRKNVHQRNDQGKFSVTSVSEFEPDTKFAHLYDIGDFLVPSPRPGFILQEMKRKDHILGTHGFAI